MTLTAPGLPGGAVAAGRSRDKVKAVPGVTDAKVDVVWEPPWTRIGCPTRRNCNSGCGDPMLRLSKKADYALMAMKHLAMRPDAASASAREIAEQYDIPIELMAKVLQRLARRGLLTSHQGTRGGYRLGRPSSAISVADIIQAIDGPLTVTACSTEAENCGQYAKCSVRDPLWRIKDRIIVGAGDLFAAGDLPPIRRPEEARDDRWPVTAKDPDGAVSRPVYLDYHATTPVDPRCSRRCCRSSPSGSATPRAAARVRLGRAGSGGRGAAAGRDADRRVGRRDRLHQRRHRVEQPGDQGRGAARCASAAITSSPSRPSTSRSSIRVKRLEREGWRVTRLGVDARRLRRSRRAARRR